MLGTLRVGRECELALTIIMDSNEAVSAPYIKRKLEELGIRVEVKRLPVGDYLIGTMCVERKSIQDFINSIMGRHSRYWEQLYNMMTNFDRRVVYLVGLYPRHIPKLKNRPFDLERFILSAMCTSYYSYGVPVIRVFSIDEFVQHLAMYYSKYGKAKATRPVSVRKYRRTIQDICSDVYCVFPRVGRKIADKLSSSYSLYEFFNLSKEEMMSVKIDGRRLGKIGELMYDIIHHVPKK